MALPGTPASAGRVQTLRRRIARWRELPADEQAVLAAALLALPCLKASLALLGVRRTLRLAGALRPVPRTSTAAPEALARGRRLTELAAVAGRAGLVTATCLPQSLFVFMALRWHGHEPRLSIGARKADGAFQAHAWVQLGDEVLEEGPLLHAPLEAPGAPLRQNAP